MGVLRPSRAVLLNLNIAKLRAGRAQGSDGNPRSLDRCTRQYGDTTTGVRFM